MTLACNPFGGDEEEDAANSTELVDVGLDESSAEDAVRARQAELMNEAEHSSEATPQPSPTAASSPGSESAEGPTSDQPVQEVGAEEAVELAWAFLSQCISLGVNDLAADQIDGEWYVQDAGAGPDRYGVWKVDPATGSVQPHNIRAREWEPRINSQCTEEAFATFYISTPVPQSSSSVTDAEQAVTSLWATLVKCYPTISTEDLQATLNPSRAEWIVTPREGITTNFGVWVVRGNGEVVPFNRQAQGIYGQLDTGLC